jgi:hypothetical protein
MTIEIQGHVESMEQWHKDKVRLTIYNSRGEKIIVDVTKAEMGGMYLPGTPVQIVIRPLSATVDRTSDGA